MSCQMIAYFFTSQDVDGLKRMSVLAQRRQETPHGGVRQQDSRKMKTQHAAHQADGYSGFGVSLLITFSCFEGAREPPAVSLIHL